MCLNSVAFLHLFHFFQSFFCLDQTIPMNTATVCIVIVGHIVNLVEIALGVVFLYGWGGWRQLYENCVYLALVVSE